MKQAFFITVLSSIFLLQTAFAANRKESTMNQDEINHTLENLLSVEEEVVVQLETPKRKSPSVGAFMQNIYSEQYYSESVMSDYFEAFYEGYNMQDYAFASECQEGGTKLLDQLYEFNLNITRHKTAVDPYYLITHIIGEEFNDSWFFCYQFGDDIYDVYATKAENFVDFGDVYLSFIFNLLSNSLNIKSSTENMIDAKELHDTTKFIKNLALILRSTFDFNSYQTVAGSIKTLATKPEDFLREYKPQTPVASKNERMRKKQEQVKVAHEKLEVRKAEKQAALEQKYGTKEGKGRLSSTLGHTTSPQVELRETYVWDAVDYIQSPFAFAIGALHALPDESFGYLCSKNLTSSRTSLLEGFEFFELKETLEGFTAVHDSLSYMDEIGLYCQLAIYTELDSEHFGNLFGDEWYYGIPVNILYNVGAQWVDGVNFWFYNPSTVPQGDWAFFAAYLLGDFLMRFFYRDETPNNN